MAAQHSTTTDFSSRYKFNGKELDQENGCYYGVYPEIFGRARYYNPSVSRWLSVDPLAEKYTSFSPYNFTLDNPVRLVDFDGRSVEDPIYGKNFWGNLKYIGNDGKNNGRVYFVSGQIKRAVKKATVRGEFFSGDLSSSNDVSSVPSQIIFTVDNSLQSTLSSDRENGGHKTFSNFLTTQWDEGNEVEQLLVEKGKMTKGSVVPFVINGIQVNINMEDLDIYYHIHPDTKGLGSSLPSNYSTIFHGKLLRRGDVPYQASLERMGYKGNPFVVGARDKRVNFYNGIGSVMKVKYKQFKTVLLSEFFLQLGL